MRRRVKIKHEFVEFIPKEREEGVLTCRSPMQQPCTVVSADAA